jgi:hypothetical protein
MAQTEQRKEVRASMIAFAYRLLMASGTEGDVFRVPAREAYDAVGWYARQNPYSGVAGWYFSLDANEVKHFLEEWAIWQRVQRYVVAH